MWQSSRWLRGINQGVGLERRRSLDPTKIEPLIIKIKDAQKRRNLDASNNDTLLYNMHCYFLRISYHLYDRHILYER